jgi:hypothetical protein
MGCARGTSTCKTSVNNKISCSRTSYERHFKKFKVECVNYSDIINILNDNKFQNSNLQLNLHAMDGVSSEYIMNNKLHTNQDIYSYDSICNIPLNLIENKNITIFNNNKNNKSNKNGETVIVNKYFENLNGNKETYKNSKKK